jgi:hypothetical protein
LKERPKVGNGPPKTDVEVTFQPSVNLDGVTRC